MTERNSPHKAGNHNIVAIGASAGGLHVLERVLGDLPSDLPAAVFAVLHLGASSHLGEILDRKSVLPVHSAKSGMKIQSGHVYVGIPAVHMLIHDSHLLLRRGPRENFARPAIDPLFRSAACTFGGAVIGVVLSGALNDGTAGLRAIKRCGGLAVVQDPADAAVPSMPVSALRSVDVDHAAPAAKLGSLIARLVAEPAGVTQPIPADIRLETAIAAQELAGMQAEDALGKPSRFTCPECHGTLWEMNDQSMLRFRCHVGHAYTGEAILAAQENETERMLWNLMRTHQERAELARLMAGREIQAHRLELGRQLQQRAKEYDEDAELVRRLLGDAREGLEEATEQGDL